MQMDRRHPRRGAQLGTRWTGYPTERILVAFQRASRFGLHGVSIGRLDGAVFLSGGTARPDMP